MTEVIGVRFKKIGKVYYFDPHGIAVHKGVPVIVETARGQEYGEVAMPNTLLDDARIIQPLKPLVRLATPADTKVLEQNEAFEKEAFRICEEKIAAHKLEMKLVTVEYTFDHGKLLFYFSADGRVDFRELVKDLASVFRTRIELRQIGVRDEAKMIGGLGVCGCTLCCSTFLKEFQPVSINMAKDQGLSLNPSKISGTCGRLMCCLKYENEAYQEMVRQTPPNESLVDTPYGRGNVMDSSLLRGTCRVRMLNNPDSPVTVPCSQCTVLRRGKDKGESLPEEMQIDSPSLLATLEDGDLAAVSVPAPQPQPQRQKNNRPFRQNRPQNRQEYREKSGNAREEATERTLQTEGKKNERNPKSANRNSNRPRQKQNRNNQKPRDNVPAQQPSQVSAPEAASAPSAPSAPSASAPQRNNFNRNRNRRGGYYRSGFRSGKKPEGGDKPASVEKE